MVKNKVLNKIGLDLIQQAYFFMFLCQVLECYNLMQDNLREGQEEQVTPYSGLPSFEDL